MVVRSLSNSVSQRKLIPRIFFPVVEKGCHAGESHIALAEEIQNKVVLHVNVPSATSACFVLNDGLRSLVVCEDLDRQVGLVDEFLKQIDQPSSLSTSIRGSTILSL